MFSPRSLCGPSLLKVMLFNVFIAGATFSFAETNEFGNEIGNFGKIDENYYRGGQPDESDIPALKKLGIKAVIDLQEKGESEEGEWVRNAGMKFFKIPLSSKRRPTAAQTEYFLKLVGDPDNLPVYVHCAAGKHRTGSMTAIYRITNDSWTAERAYREMEDFGYYAFPTPLRVFGLNHILHKKYVFEYYDQYQRTLKQNLDNMVAAPPVDSTAEPALNAH